MTIELADGTLVRLEAVFQEDLTHSPGGRVVALVGISGWVYGVVKEEEVQTLTDEEQGSGGEPCPEGDPAG
jgi:hypothetical protein